MFEKNKYKTIYKMIKAHDTIVIARHIGPDPDALGSSIGLRDSIRKTFPNKKVYAVGVPTSKFKYMGVLDNFSEEMYQDSLLIATDTPDRKRVDGVDPNRFKTKIKIDHHPFIETFCDYEWIDDSSSSASEMIIDLINHTKLKLDTKIAETLYMGLVSDTERFLFETTSPKTFRMVAKLIEDTDLKITTLYPNLYTRPLKEIKFQGYIANHFTVTENGCAYIKLTDEVLKEYRVDVATGGNLINNFNFIQEIICWTIFTEDKNNGVIRVSIRSRGPVINDVALSFGGGGHKYASGVKLRSFEDCDKLVEALDEACLKYQQTK